MSAPERKPAARQEGAQFREGAPVWMLDLGVREKEWLNKIKMTMPGRFVMQQFLKQAQFL